MSSSMGQKVAISNRRGDVLFEDYTGGLSTLDVTHRHIHEGEFFIASHRFTAVGNGSSVNMKFTAGSVKEAHVEVAVMAGGTCYVDAYYGSTHSSGSSVTAFNAELYNTDSTATSVVLHTVSGGSDGTAFVEDMLPGGTKSNAIGGVAASRQEIVIPPTRNVLIKVTNQSGSSTAIAIRFGWYEHSPEG